jgi:pyridoxine 5-phosphate synthase
VLTSNAGWNTLEQQDMLQEIIARIKSYGVRTSIFVEPDVEMVAGAAETGTDRIELYTEMYAREYLNDPEKAAAPYYRAAEKAKELGLGINAGHDLDLHNLADLKRSIPYLDEVSIGHALVCDALYYGWENTIQMYLRQLS